MVFTTLAVMLEIGTVQHPFVEVLRRFFAEKQQLRATDTEPALSLFVGLYVNHDDTSTAWASWWQTNVKYINCTG